MIIEIKKAEEMPETRDNSLTEYFGYCAQARLGEIYRRNIKIGKMSIAARVSKSSDKS